VPETSTGDTPPNIYDYITDHNTFLPKCTCHQDPAGGRAGIQYGYNLGLLTTVKGNGRQYDIEYDGEGNVKTVDIDGTAHVTTEIDYGSSTDTSTTTYANGYKSKVTYDEYGCVTKTQEGYTMDMLTPILLTVQEKRDNVAHKYKSSRVRFDINCLKIAV